MESRKILSVCVGSRSNAVSDQLLASDWISLFETDVASARRIQTQQQVQVGLILLADFSPGQLGEVEEWLQLSSQMEWVGVFRAEALVSTALRELVLNCFFDYHTLPVDWPVLNLTLGHAFRRSLLRSQSNHRPKAEDCMGMVGHSPAVAHLQQQIRKVAATDAPVLIGGESGSGKELAARAIHQLSRRVASPFIAVNCGAIAPSLIQSELFGHERGSFTGATAGKLGLIEAASGGTLFLDEIADLPLELQTNLLRFLQEHTIHRVGSTRSLQVDVRVVAASHIDLASAVAAGRFREDLFYRLNVLPITVPSLRERISDVPELAQHFLRGGMAGQQPRRVEGFSRQAVAAMMSHPWPGNVRELFNRVQRAVVMTDQRLITPADLGLAVASPAGIELDTARTLAERDAIAFTLVRVGRNITHAARDLGISRMTLYRLMDKHGLSPRA